MSVMPLDYFLLAALVFLSGVAGFCYGHFLALSKEVQRVWHMYEMLAQANSMTVVPATIDEPPLEPEDVIEKAIDALVSPGEVDALAEHLMAQNYNLTEEEARQEAETILSESLRINT